MTSRTCDIAAAGAASVIRTDERFPSTLNTRIKTWMVKALDGFWARIEHRRQMRQLAALDDRMLRDLGLNPGQVAGYERHSPHDLIRNPEIYGR